MDKFIEIILESIKNYTEVIVNISYCGHLIMSKSSRIDDYKEYDNGLIYLYDEKGEIVVCPDNNPMYDEDEDIFIYNIGENIKMSIMFTNM